MPLASFIPALSSESIDKVRAGSRGLELLLEKGWVIDQPWLRFNLDKKTKTSKFYCQNFARPSYPKVPPCLLPPRVPLCSVSPVMQCVIANLKHEKRRVYGPGAHNVGLLLHWLSQHAPIEVKICPFRLWKFPESLIYIFSRVFKAIWREYVIIDNLSFFLQEYNEYKAEVNNILLALSRDQLSKFIYCVYKVSRNHPPTATRLPYPAISYQSNIASDNQKVRLPSLNLFFFLFFKYTATGHGPLTLPTGSSPNFWTRWPDFTEPLRLKLLTLW